jgi:hypothetical protein
MPKRAAKVYAGCFLAAITRLSHLATKKCFKCIVKRIAQGDADWSFEVVTYQPYLATKNALSSWSRGQHRVKQIGSLQ